MEAWRLKIKPWRVCRPAAANIDEEQDLRSLLADYKENHALLWFKKSLIHIHNRRKLQSIHE
jgi:hypothetical protein